jgi:hypothetical protein
MRPDDTLTVADAFLAMRIFMYRFQERRDLGAEAVPSILRWTSLREWKQTGADPVTGDPAQWLDWVNAVREALEGVDPDDVVPAP